MAYFITPNVTADNSAFPLRQAEGKVLGRVRSLVKGSTLRAGVKDYRFLLILCHRCRLKWEKARGSALPDYEPQRLRFQCFCR